MPWHRSEFRDSGTGPLAGQGALMRRLSQYASHARESTPRAWQRGAMGPGAGGGETTATAAGVGRRWGGGASDGSCPATDVAAIAANLPLTYCEGWNDVLHQPFNPMSEAEARRRHETGELYPALLGDPAVPDAMVEGTPGDRARGCRLLGRLRATVGYHFKPDGHVDVRTVDR